MACEYCSGEREAEVTEDGRIHVCDTGTKQFPFSHTAGTGAEGDVDYATLSIMTCGFADSGGQMPVMYLDFGITEHAVARIGINGAEAEEVELKVPIDWEDITIGFDICYCPFCGENLYKRDMSDCNG